MTIPDHMIEQYTDWVYRFRIDQPMTEDASVLVCLRNKHTDDEWINEVLTVDGWQRYNEYELLPSNLPKMTGLDLRLDRTRQQEMVDAVHRAFQANGAEDIRVDM